MNVLPMDQLAKNFGRNLETFRESLGLSQTDLAKKMKSVPGWEKYSQVAVSRTEAGQRTVRLDEAFALAQCVGEPLESLLSAPEMSRWYSAALKSGATLEESKSAVDMACVRYVADLRNLRELLDAKPSVAELERLTGIKKATASTAIKQMQTLAKDDPKKVVRDMIDDAAEYLDLPLGNRRKWNFEKDTSNEA